jgi:hypothetical protein
LLPSMPCWVEWAPCVLLVDPHLGAAWWAQQWLLELGKVPN